jgi:hypothetical protein
MPHRAAIICLGLIAGCAGSQSRQAEAELSLAPALEADSSGQILLDGKPVQETSMVRISPGRHSIAADCGMVWAHGPPVIEFAFVAAARYKLVCRGHALTVMSFE